MWLFIYCFWFSMQTVVRTKTSFAANYREPFLLVLAQGTVLLPVTQLARANTLTVRTAEVVLATAGSLVTPVRTLNIVQSRQSARLLLQSSELGRPLPTPHPSNPLPLWFRGVRTRLRETGWGVPIWTRGQTLWYSIGVYLLWAEQYIHWRK